MAADDAERGSAALAAVLAGCVAWAACAGVVLAVTDIAVAGARARLAADAAALAGAASGDGDAMAAARRLATVNGAALTACCAGGEAADAAAAVQVDVAAVPRTALGRLLVPQVRARAAAAASAQGVAGRLGRPVAGRITSDFGWRTDPFTGERRFHSGIDLAAPSGHPVRAAAAGVVTTAGFRGGYGRTVVIEHERGVTTLYAHLSSTAVGGGDVVAAGDVIGAVGSTGRSSGAHLHFEVRRGGVPQDPARYW